MKQERVAKLRRFLNDIAEATDTIRRQADHLNSLRADVEAAINDEIHDDMHEEGGHFIPPSQAKGPTRELPHENLKP